MTVENRESFIFTARVLGALFYYPPQSEPSAPLVSAFTHNEWMASWPLAQNLLLPLAEQFSADGEEPLTDAWQRLFIGPWALPAPPWGSVWLDKECVLFGDSTLALRQWLRDNNIAFEMQQNEPEDHIGTLLQLAAWLAEQGKTQACDELLAWHLLPWSGRFLAVLEEHAQHPFWQALARLAQLTLAEWRANLLMPVAQKALFR